MKKKNKITFDEFLDQNPKFKKKFNKKYEEYQNRPKRDKILKIGLEYIRKNFNLDLFLKNIEKYNYKFMDEGNMFNRIIGYGFKQDKTWKIYDHLDDSEVDKMYKLAETYELLPKITDNFKVFDLKVTETSEKLISCTTLYSKKNSTYYLFVDEYNSDGRGNCLYYKSKNKKIIFTRIDKLVKGIKN
tara:strand:- start:99 stop:659 length:561 start_codon:yes stop_codon:yes gene_type:complete